MKTNYIQMKEQNGWRKKPWHFNSIKIWVYVYDLGIGNFSNKVENIPEKK